MPHFEFEIKSTDGLKLQGQGWEPNVASKKVVCLVHGIGEHSGRYDHVAETFNQAGYALLTFDLRGHGRSEGKRGHATNFDILISDISQLLATAKQRFPNRQTFLYGHSFGGGLVIRHALSQRAGLAGVIASAPLFRTTFKPPARKMVLLRTLYGLRPSLTIPSGVEDMALSRDLNMVRLYRSDPLIHDRISARLTVDMLRNGEWNLQHAAEFPCPLLLMHGGADRITSPEASRQFAKKAGSACTLKIWKGLFHELHNEPEQNEVLNYVLTWLAAVTDSSP
jgi:acylglycerol lipase